MTKCLYYEKTTFVAQSFILEDLVEPEQKLISRNQKDSYSSRLIIYKYFPTIPKMLRYLRTDRWAAGQTDGRTM